MVGTGGFIAAGSTTGAASLPTTPVNRRFAGGLRCISFSGVLGKQDGNHPKVFSSLANRSIIRASLTLAVKRITGRKADGLEKSPSVIDSQNTTPFESSGSFPTVDLYFEGHGSLFLIRPTSPAGKTWLEENVGDSETQTWGGATACEQRYVENILRGALAEGLVCR
jgi:hypothetical protein